MATPMAHVSKSMLGSQVSSLLASSPSFGFGTEERLKASSVKAGGLTASPGPVYFPSSATYNNYPHSPSHSFGASHRYTLSSSGLTQRTGRGDTVPGPGMYHSPAAITKQSDSRKHSFSSFGFGTSTRADQSKIFVSAEHAKTETNFIDSPGPCAYRQDGSFGLQTSSRAHSSASYKMGTSDRFFHDRKTGKADADLTPSPGTYRVERAVGKQASSMKPSYPHSSFTKADRDRTSLALYQGKLQRSACWGRHSPGPGLYGVPSTLGTQASSVKRSAPRAGFGTAGRFDYIDSALRERNTPGPGSYSV